MTICQEEPSLSETEFQELLGQLRVEPNNEVECEAKYNLFSTYAETVEVLRKEV